MRLSEFRVQKYKTISDTGWVKIRPDVTCLLGKNESGKSAVMQAIWKFKNARGIGYDFLYDYPKEHYARDRGTDPVVTSLRFALEDHEREALAATKLPDLEAVEVDCTYAGRKSYVLDLPPSQLAMPQIVRDLQRIFSTPSDDEQIEAILVTARPLVEQLVGADQDLAVARAAATQLRQVLPQVSVLLADRQAEYASALDDLAALKLPEETRAALEQWLEAKLPTFIYFDDYGRLETRINLSSFLTQREANAIEPRVRTQMALFQWTKLDASELHRLGQPIQPNETHDMVQRRKDERASLTESASYGLTGDWMDWWDQRRHALNIDADGDDLVLRVSDDQNPWKIPFHERSKGFQWFFSFYLTFLVESEQAHAGAILLLDEPGLHLHIRAQQKLLAFFQRISKKNQTIYSSHSPFMVDPMHLDNVRTVYLKKLEGSERVYTHVSVGTEPQGDRDTMLPLQAALGYEIAQTLFLGKRTLIVEGISDYCLIQALKVHFAETGKALLDDNIVVLFAGGTSNMLPLVSLFAQPASVDRQLVVLLDGDKAGVEKAAQLQRDLLPGGNSVVLMSDPDILDTRQAELEDIVHRDELLSAVTRLKGPNFKMPEKPTALNVPFMNQLYNLNGWGAFNHERKVECLLAVIDGWRTKSDPPSPATLKNAERFLRGLASRFS